VRLDQSLTALASADCALIFSVEAPLLLEGDAGDAGEPVRLEPWDLAVISQGTVRLRRIEADTSSASSAVFFATINH